MPHNFNIFFLEGCFLIRLPSATCFGWDHLNWTRLGPKTLICSTISGKFAEGDPGFSFPFRRRILMWIFPALLNSRRTYYPFAVGGREISLPGIVQPLFQKPFSGKWNRFPWASEFKCLDRKLFSELINKNPYSQQAKFW